MELLEKITGDILFLYPRGNNDDEISAGFEFTLNRILGEDTPRNVCINCWHVDYLNSSACRVLVNGARYLLSHDCTLYLCCMNDVVEKIVKSLSIDRLVAIEKSEDEVLKSVSMMSYV